jgi:hypothetical protein
VEGEHAKMWETPCNMTGSSMLQIKGKWYQERNKKNKPDLKKT